MLWFFMLFVVSFVITEQAQDIEEGKIGPLGDLSSMTDRSNSSVLLVADDYNRQIYPCNIRRISHSELSSLFPPMGLVPSLYKEPIIITTEPPYYNGDFQERTKQTNILLQFPPGFDVRLSSSNSYSSHRRTIPLYLYLQEVLVEYEPNNNLSMKSNETWYLFGETFSDEWKTLLNHFILPPCQTCSRALSSLSFGLGGFASGVQWHFHGPGFSEVIHGSKHWILFPPTVSKNSIPFYDDPSYTSFSWIEEIYETLSLEMKKQLVQCTLYPGEMIYFPDSWHHATVNTGYYNVFVSTFTTEHAT